MCLPLNVLGPPHQSAVRSPAVARHAAAGGCFGGFASCFIEHAEPRLRTPHVVPGATILDCRQARFAPHTLAEQRLIYEENSRPTWDQVPTQVNLLV